MAALKIVKLDVRTLQLLDAVWPDVFHDAIGPARAAAFVADPAHLLVLAIDDADNDAARGLYRALGAPKTQNVAVYNWDTGS